MSQAHRFRDRIPRRCEAGSRDITSLLTGQNKVKIVLPVASSSILADNKTHSTSLPDAETITSSTGTLYDPFHLCVKRKNKRLHTQGRWLWTMTSKSTPSSEPASLTQSVTLTVRAGWSGCTKSKTRDKLVEVTEETTITCF